MVVDDKRGLIYLSTDSEIMVMIYLPDDVFGRAIALEWAGFQALAIRQEHGEAAIFGAQRNRNLPPFAPSPCSVGFSGDMPSVVERESRVTIIDKTGTPIFALGDHTNLAQWRISEHRRTTRSSGSSLLNMDSASAKRVIFTSKTEAKPVASPG